MQKLVCGSRPEQFSNFMFAGHLHHSTGLHFDVSDVFVTVIIGRKLCILVCREDLELLKLSPNEKATLTKPYGLSDHVDIPQTSWSFLTNSKSPTDPLEWSKSIFGDALVYWSILKQSDTVYIPKGWIHCFINLEFSVSVSSQFYPSRKP